MDEIDTFLASELAAGHGGHLFYARLHHLHRSVAFLRNLRPDLFFCYNDQYNESIIERRVFSLSLSSVSLYVSFSAPHDFFRKLLPSAYRRWRRDLGPGSR